jgi:peroxiredoxin
MARYNEVLSEFQKHEAVLLGISVDGAWCHQAFAKCRHLHFPLLADFEPKGAVARKYGAYRAGANGILNALEWLEPATPFDLPVTKGQQQGRHDFRAINQTSS